MQRAATSRPSPCPRRALWHACRGGTRIQWPGAFRARHRRRRGASPARCRRRSAAAAGRRTLVFRSAQRSRRTQASLDEVYLSRNLTDLTAIILLYGYFYFEMGKRLEDVMTAAQVKRFLKAQADPEIVVESNIHPPTDSELLYDCVRVLTPLMCGARELLGTVVVFGNRTRRAKRRRLGVLNAKGDTSSATHRAIPLERPGREDSSTTEARRPRTSAAPESSPAFSLD